LKNFIKLSLISLISSVAIYAQAVDAKQYSAITKEPGVKIVYLWAPWCGNCSAFKPVYESVKNQFPNIKFYEINGDSVNDPFSTFGIKYGYPAVQIFKNGVKLDTQEGGMTKEEMVNWINHFK